MWTTLKWLRCPVMNKSLWVAFMWIVDIVKLTKRLLWRLLVPSVSVMTWFSWINQKDWMMFLHGELFFFFCLHNTLLLTVNDINYIFFRGTVEALCMNCDTEGNSTVHFHCNTCSNEGSILQHLKANRENIECLICGENEPLVFALDCEHVSCVPCISAFMETNLKQWLFVYKSEIGFTMKCPMVDCNSK